VVTDAVATTPPSTVPARRPRIGAGFALLPVDGGLLIEGGMRRRRLTGTTATAILPTLLASLDGTIDPDELAARHRLRRQDLDRVLTVLDECGITECDS
jgi:hypothetical protein